MKKFWEICLRLVYPPRCCFCGEISKEPLCDKCKEKVIYIKEPRCKKCGKPIRSSEQEYCYDCREHRHYYDQGKSIWLHKQPVSQSIYQFKYNNKRVFGTFYAKELVRLYGRWIEQKKIEVIIPVPAHKARRRQRGYNQAEIVAKCLAEDMGLPVCSNAIIRTEKTMPQKALDKWERKRNLQHVFRVTKHWENWKRILIIDDIYTTGSTIDTLTRECKQNGAEKVWFLTISIGQGF